MCLLHFENNLLTIEGKVFASLRYQEHTISEAFIRFCFASVDITTTEQLCDRIYDGYPAHPRYGEHCCGRLVPTIPGRF